MEMNTLSLNYEKYIDFVPQVCKIQHKNQRKL